VTAFSAWCVVATDWEYEARELPYADITAPFVVAIHASRGDAEQGANRAILFREAAQEKYDEVFKRERAVRAEVEPGSSAWTASVAHETTILNRIALGCREAAQPHSSAIAAP